MKNLCEGGSRLASVEEKEEGAYVRKMMMAAWNMMANQSVPIAGPPAAESNRRSRDQLPIPPSHHTNSAQLTQLCLSHTHGNKRHPPPDKRNHPRRPHPHRHASQSITPALAGASSEHAVAVRGGADETGRSKG